jgi:Tfp pilus assembly protein PilN
MRVLGELIVILGFAAVAMIVLMRRVISPALRRRHIAQLEEENERLDRIIERRREDQP